ncbi:MAG: hypothetical protein HYY51_02360 [Candidatus Magasanikbacteria bacterium]|nr:hypothetical protein [Candidatus Magasanikbacteria bacterium]
MRKVFSQTLKHKLILTILGFFVYSLLFVPGIAGAEDPPAVSPLQEEIGKQTGAFAGTQGAQYGKPSLAPIIAARLVQMFLTFIGTLFIIYTVYGGYLYMTSAGNEDRINKANSIISHGVLGVAVMLMSYSVAYFVVDLVLFANEDDDVSYFQWGVLNSGYYKGQDPLKGYGDPLEGDAIPDQFKLYNQ